MSSLLPALGFTLGYEVVSATTTYTESVTATVSAPDGMKVVGGGWSDFYSDMYNYVIGSHPSSDGGQWNVDVSYSAPGPPPATSQSITVWAVCVSGC